VRGIEFDEAGYLTGDGNALARGRIERGRQHVRLADHAAIDEDTQGMCHLQGRIGIVALTDGGRQRLAAEPLLLARLLEPLPFPFARRQHPGRFAGQVDAGALSEPQFTHEGTDGIDSQLVTQRIEIDVAGEGQRPVQIDPLWQLLFLSYNLTPEYSNIPCRSNRCPGWRLPEVSPSMAMKGLKVEPGG